MKNKIALIAVTVSGLLMSELLSNLILLEAGPTNLLRVNVYLFVMLMNIKVYANITNRDRKT